jgi:hypothetical protein
MKSMILATVLVLAGTLAHAADAKSFDITGFGARKLNGAMEDTAFKLDTSNNASTYYGKVKCQQPAGKSLVCTVTESTADAK